MRTVLAYLRPLAGRMAACFGIKLTGTLMDLAIPWILAHLLDEVVPTGSRAAILLWGLAMALCALVAWLGNVIANRRASAISRDATRRIRHDLYRKVGELSSRQLDQLTIPSLISRLTSDTYNVNQTLGRIQRLGVRAPLLLLGGIFVTLLLDWRLSLVLLATLPFLALAIRLISARGLRRYTLVQRQLDAMVRTVRDDLTGIRVIRALGKADLESERFRHDSATLSRSQVRADAIMAAMDPMMQLILNLGLTAVILCGAHWVSQGVTRPGSIIAFLTYFTIILNAMMSINKMFVMLTQASASASRIEEVLKLPPETHTPANPETPLPSATPLPHLAFSHVSFAYSHPERGHTLHDLSLELAHGQTLGVIGTTGSGKTTLIQLLQRLYPLDEGSITLDGQPLDSFDEHTLRQHFGVAFQSDAFFAGTIRDNIDLGRNLPQHDLELAARTAQAEDFIRATPEGYDHPVHAKAANLSGGQRQRLLIARALAAHPPILILDDASSALDYRTDAALRAAIRQNYPDTTVILIAQRVSSVRHADLIHVLDHGRAAGLGTHQQLLRDCPLYAQLDAIQTGDQPHETA
ncbi:MAG: ABC transporter ATP-binding protein [Oligosphaeraceae bacterium]